MSMEPEEPVEALSHLSKTFNLVNERIAEGKADATSDGTIAVIVIMSKYGLAAGHAQQGPIHLDGLQRMVEMRGGMTTLTNYKPSMTQKIFRADLEWSLCLGSATRFSIDDVERRSTAIIGRSRLFGGPRDRTKDGETSSASSQPFKRLSPSLEELLFDSRELAFMLNEASVGRRSKICIYTMDDTIILLGYRLVHQCPLSRELLLTHGEKSVHIGLTAFIRTFLVGLDGKIAENILLTQLVMSIASQEEEPGNNDETAKNTEELVLWVLLIAVAATAIGSIGNDRWLMPRLERIASALDLQKAEDVLQVASKFPWVNELHDKAAHEVWRRFTMYKWRETTSTASSSMRYSSELSKGDDV
ncbi:hypothetical protein S7711_01272 [Stachybotrys chartarum IBT 7711]|uniref:Uncharacterized protein n=1 Tax=Stachybotrys chartarum (strain CBS 109288 / IBT 7711) TaxID=1280523 RepID=A0A084BBI9_STACB|nr:hypothetical protein S7711_01272 [Stachybotrys chartarum IBT 7711]